MAMSTAVKEKTEKLENYRIRARAIMAAHEKTGALPPEEELQVKTLIDEAEKLQGEIASERKMDDARRDLERLDTFLDAPANRLPMAANGDDDSYKALTKAGWEVKGGFIFAPTSMQGETIRLSSGEVKTVGLQPMYSVETLFGDFPDDDKDTADYMKKTRAIFQPGYRPAFERYHRLCGKYRSEVMAFNMLSGSEQKALSEGTDTSGGFIVPPDIQAEMLVRLPQKAVIRQYARVQPTNRDTLRWPAVKANAGTTYGIDTSHIYSSGFVGSWTSETPAFTDTDASFQTHDIAIKKVRVATKLSNDFIGDAAVNVLSWLAMNGSENMALTEDAGFIQGDGSALQPRGLLNLGITTVDIEGTTADTITNTTSLLGSATKLINLAYQLPAQYVSGARWLMRRTIEGKIRQLVDGSGRFLWPPFTGSGFAAAPPDLLGFPVVHSDWMPDDGAAVSPGVVLLGDLSQYIIGQRTQITSIVLRERFADSDQVGIILFERIGGSAYNTDAFRIGLT